MMAMVAMRWRERRRERGFEMLMKVKGGGKKVE